MILNAIYPSFLILDETEEYRAVNSRTDFIINVQIPNGNLNSFISRTRRTH